MSIPLALILLVQSPGAGIAGAVGEEQPPTPRTDPAYWIGSADYPVDSIVLEEEGDIVFRLEVNAEGSVTNCIIVESSGYSRLDERTCQLLPERAEFFPARDADGDRVSGEYSQSVRWQIPGRENLPRGRRPMPTPFELEYRYTVNSEGRVTSCEVISRVNVPDEVDLCGQILSPYLSYEPFQDENGVAVGRSVVVRSSLSIE